MKPLKPKYDIDDIVILKDGQALSRCHFPKGKVEVKIKSIDLESCNTVRYRVILKNPDISRSSQMEYVCLENEIIESFNPSKRNSYGS
jgi:hypothetical protein